MYDFSLILLIYKVLTGYDIQNAISIQNIVHMI